MPVAKPREVATPTPTGQEGAPAPAAAHRGRRLGKGARRDIRWALRQHPGDDVREIMLHGVKIRFHSGPTDKDGTHGIWGGARRADRDEVVREPPATPPLNSRQKRSRARANHYYAKLHSATDGPAPAAEMTAQDMDAEATSPQRSPRPAPPPRAPVMSQVQSAQGNQRYNDGATSTFGSSFVASGRGRGKGSGFGKGQGRERGGK